MVFGWSKARSMTVALPPLRNIERSAGSALPMTNIQYHGIFATLTADAEVGAVGIGEARALQPFAVAALIVVAVVIRTHQLTSGAL